MEMRHEISVWAPHHRHISHLKQFFLQKKCERYWPNADEVEVYDNLTVISVTENCYEDYLVREFDVTDDKKSVRTIYQYQFTVRVFASLRSCAVTLRYLCCAHASRDSPACVGATNRYSANFMDVYK